MSNCKYCNAKIIWDWVDVFPSGKPKPKEVVEIGRGGVIVTGQVHKCPKNNYMTRRLAQHKFNPESFAFENLCPLPELPWEY